jgi:amino acid adenylation domain-containing protein/non-ribosomal peptide synthase protein (TIGR01720 family)
MPQGNIQGFRLSPQQKRLWLLQQTATLSPFWARCLVRIRGKLEDSVLEKAIRTVIEEHEILRTTFRLLPGMTLPVQAISDASHVCIKRHDLTFRDVRQQAEMVLNLYAEGADHPVAYDRLPLFRLNLVELAADESVLLLRVPALCADGRSLENLVTQIASSYASLSRGEAAAVPGGLQYADFAEWQNEMVESAESASGRQYWNQDDLQDAPELRIPFENQVSTKTSFRPAKVTVDLAPEVTSLIIEHANNTGERFAIFILTCWQILLWQLTDCSDLIVGTAFEGRKYAVLENSVGLYSRYLPIHTRFRNDELPFVQLLQRVSEREGEAAKWQEYFPPESIEALRTSAAQGYFPFCFEERNELRNFTADNLSFSIDRHDVCIDRFKLKLVCESSDHSPTLELHFDSSLFVAEDIQRLREELSTLITDSSQAPKAAIRQLQVVGSHERNQILKEFNDTKREYQQVCIHKLFEAQVERVPNVPAVIYDSSELTYAQLNKSANRLAHHLRKLGVGPDRPVGLCLERSLEFVVGLLAILKAGGAYVPLDPGLPDDRLALLLNEVGACVLLAGQNLRKDFPQGHTVYLRSDAGFLAEENSNNCESEVGPENLVYVIFTSGSTGRPKGVAVEHRQLANYIQAVQEKLDLSGIVRFALVSTLAADLAHTVLFPSLTSGGTLHLISEEKATNPEALADYFKANPVDCLKIVPSHLSALLSSSNPAHILPRQRLILGGEPCTQGLLDKIKGLNGTCAVWNHYGPTETTVGSVAQQIDFPADWPSKAVPIGQPLANTTAYILNRQFQLVPIGASGILYIGGCGVARGYIFGPDPTAEKFVPDPFGDEIGGRLYKTGDLARYLSDGRIEFLGRADHQLKIHGYRIEPAEIEAALCQHPLVEQCVVIAREDPPGGKRLVAYVVAKNSQLAFGAVLRDFLTNSLPEYMIPTTFVSLESLPLTPNGKIDRNALPQPEAHAVGKNLVAPRNDVEQLLATIWSSVLGKEELGVDDNFFELGGDSILSIQIIARANQAGLGLAPRQLFQHQTIAELAIVAKNGFIQKAEQDPVIGEVPLLPVQAGFFELDHPEPHHYNQARLLELREAPDASLFERAVAFLVFHHDALRLRFQLAETCWKQVNVAPGDIVPFESINVSHLGPAEITVTIKRVAARLHESLNLQNGPIIRVALFDGGVKGTSYLLIVIHHLAVDGVSWRVLLEDLEKVYHQSKVGKEMSLGPKTTSFKAWAERLTDYAHSDGLLNELTYWLSLFSRLPGKLPVDGNGINNVASRRTVSVSLCADDTRLLLHDFPARYRTQINEVLLTALVSTFKKWAGYSSLLLDLEGHGREEIISGLDVSRTIGWFTTIFPLVLDIGESATSIDVLRSVKDQLRAIPNRGIGYGLLRYSCGEAAVVDKLRALSQAEIRFNYLGQLDRLLAESSLFSVSQHSIGPAQSPKGMRAYLLNIIATVINGELRLEWTYSENIHRSGTVERLALTYLDELRALIAHSRTQDAPNYIPSDFPSARLSQEDLNKVLAKFRA